MRKFDERGDHSGCGNARVDVRRLSPSPPKAGAGPLAPASAFFSKLATLGMSEPEIALHELQIERKALVRRATEHCNLRRELDAVNAAFQKAVADVHRHRAANLKDGEKLYLNVYKTNTGR